MSAIRQKLRTRNLMVRLTEQEYKWLHDVAERGQISVSEAFRRMMANSGFGKGGVNEK